MVPSKDLDYKVRLIKLVEKYLRSVHLKTIVRSSRGGGPTSSLYFVEGMQVSLGIADHGVRLTECVGGNGFSSRLSGPMCLIADRGLSLP